MSCGSRELLRCKNKLELIGSGGYGKVYKIKENSSSANHAVKIVSGLGGLKRICQSGRRVRERIQSGDGSLGNHPRIIQFFAIVRDEKNFQIMLVMEYMEGGSLADKLKDQNPLPDNSVLKYLYKSSREWASFIERKYTTAI